MLKRKSDKLVERLFMLQTDFVQKITSIVDQRILSLPIKKNHERMIELKDYKSILFRPSPEVPDNQDYTEMITL